MLWGLIVLGVCLGRVGVVLGWRRWLGFVLLGGFWFLGTVGIVVLFVRNCFVDDFLDFLGGVDFLF